MKMEDNIEMSLRETGGDGVCWIDLAKNMNQ
jgi:hypothetical protein